MSNNKNNKNKELSLLYIINTFGKSYSSESNEKNKIIIDLPKISKNLFSKPHPKSNSCKNLENLTFQKYLPIKKCFSKGGIMNNFFSSIYEKQKSSGQLINGQKSGKTKGALFYSVKKNKKFDISPFINGNYKFSTLFNDNNEIVNNVNDKDKIKNNNIKENNNNPKLIDIIFGGKK